MELLESYTRFSEPCSWIKWRSHPSPSLPHPIPYWINKLTNKWQGKRLPRLSQIFPCHNIHVYYSFISYFQLITMIKLQIQTWFISLHLECNEIPKTCNPTKYRNKILLFTGNNFFRRFGCLIDWLEIQWSQTGWKIWLFIKSNNQIKGCFLT